MSTANTLTINETFYSIQGEGTCAGLPCVFVRLTGCHLRCGYCDTAYAFHDGSRCTVDQIIAGVHRIGRGCRLVQVTGGEPLLQPNVHPLMSRLCDLGYTVLLETSGACDIAPCDTRVIRIVDLKTPDSGEQQRNLWSNIEQLTEKDEVKFVICSRRDYEWARDVISKYDLAQRGTALLLSPVSEIAPSDELPGSQALSIQELAEWIMQDNLPVRLQIQLHKLIWDPLTRGV